MLEDFHFKFSFVYNMRNIYHLIITIVFSLQYNSHSVRKKYLPYLFERKSDRDNTSLEVIIIFLSMSDRSEVIYHICCRVTTIKRFFRL